MNGRIVPRRGTFSKGELVLLPWKLYAYNRLVYQNGRTSRGEIRQTVLPRHVATMWYETRCYRGTP